MPDRVNWGTSLVAVLMLGVCAMPALAAPDEPIPHQYDADIKRVREAMLTDPAAAFRLAMALERRAVTMAPPGKRATLANTRGLAAEALVRIDRSDRAAPLIASAVALARSAGDARLLGDVLLTKANAESDTLRAADALQSYQQAFESYRAAGHPRGQAIALQGIAGLYVMGGDHATADRYYRQSEEVFSGDPILSLTLSNNRATSLLALDRFDAAIAEYRKALAIARELESEPFTARILHNLAKADVEAGRLAAADIRIAQARAITASPEAASFRPHIDVIEAEARFAGGRMDEARRLIDRAFEGVEIETTTLPYRDAHVAAYNIYEALGDAPLALAHLTALRRLTDEETRLAASTNTALMAARFDFANQELRIARLKADELRAGIALERSNARFQQTLFTGLGGGALVIVLLLSIGLFTIRRSRNQVRDANAELATTNVALGKALAAKTEFLATTSHEIRTPLNGILGMAQVMLAARDLPPAHRDRVSVVHDAGVAMRALVDDILDVAKMETGHLEIAPAPVDLLPALEELSRMWGDQARAKGLGFKADFDAAPGWIETDAGRLRQIVSNLLSNAIKFTASGGVCLSARADAAKGRLLISIRDSGIGIPADRIEEVFETFRQADSTTTREYGGTGLGLAICRNLARALGGDVRVESVVGEGSTFTVDLPLIEASAPAIVEQGACSDMLIVDRNPITRAMLRTLVAPHVAGVAFAGDADAAIAAIASDHPHCVLVDDASLAGDDDDARIATLARITGAAGAHGASLTVLWRAPDAAVCAAIEAAGATMVVAKPVAGAALLAKLFGETSETSLVSNAA
ncbi:ATP-binding protein [Sphingomonas baiyangensis]|uniref:histidine kinase n=1 Tax=Sphingomonas baiyangensis TaxID=2572576 RepID=A0A4U1L4W9_9SPHN|nr:ATP-binding protein [Sphingomonas baiyangensis]TKD51235.1 tetratricopeptide repeat protein [Sphingomonas baiyangensis]